MQKIIREHTGNEKASHLALYIVELSLHDNYYSKVKLMGIRKLLVKGEALNKFDTNMTLLRKNEAWEGAWNLD